MGLLASLLGSFGVRRRSERGDAQNERGWDGSKTNRLNAAHWSGANGHSINSDLRLDLTTLRSRCIFEMQNNPFVEGMISTHITDIAGPDGPVMNIQSDDTRYNEAVESTWREFTQICDFNGQYCLSEFLESWVRMLWVGGEYLTQIVADRSADGIQTRLLDVHPSRLASPPMSVSTVDVSLGVRHNRTGRPLSFFIQAIDPLDIAGFSPLQFDEVPAEDVIHMFRPLEPGQVRGAPWLAPALPTIADIREYDAQVMDAARQAADMAVLLQAADKHTDPIPLGNAAIEIERRMMQTLPPGWEATGITPQQPTTTYPQYRAERLREIGRAVAMPLMMVVLDSSGHNYSSARFDGQVYQRMNRKLQGWIARRALNRLVRIIQREAQALGRVGEPPPGHRIVWTWPVPPHVDPQKEARASSERLRAKITTLATECAAQGLDWEEVLEQCARERDRQEELGLISASSTSDTEEEDEDAEERMIEEILHRLRMPGTGTLVNGAAS